MGSISKVVDVRKASPFDYNNYGQTLAFVSKALTQHYCSFQNNVNNVFGRVRVDWRKDTHYVSLRNGCILSIGGTNYFYKKNSENTDKDRGEEKGEQTVREHTNSKVRQYINV